MKKTAAVFFMIVVFASVMAQHVAAENGKNKTHGDGARGHDKCSMKPLHFYMDTHDKNKGTFPAALTPEQFEAFYAAYKKAMYDECVVPVRVHVSYEDGRAYCLTMSPDTEAVKRAH